MNEIIPRWRSRLFNIAVTTAAIALTLYFTGICCVTVVESIETKLRVAAWLFFAGSVLSLMVFALSLFGSGWKRTGLAVAALLSLVFWYGLTLY